MRRGTLPLALLACVIALTPLLPTPVAADVPASSGGSWTSSQAEPTEVVVGQLPAASPADLRAPSKRQQRPLRVRDAAALAAAKRSTKGPKGTSVPRNTGGALAASQTASTLPWSFTGLNSNNQSTKWEPPDTQLAAGPTTLMELVNSIGRVYNKSGGAVTGVFSLGAWFGLSSAYEAGDPRVLFDHLTQRWYATVMGFDPNTGGSKVVLAVSSSSNPAGTWRRYVVYSSSTLLCDQPKIGYSTDKFMITCTTFNVNVAPPDDFIGGVLIVASKTQALAGQAVTIGVTNPMSFLASLVPAQNMESGNLAYIVYNASTEAVLIAITGDPASGLSHVFWTPYTVPMTPTSPPVNAPQFGSASLIDTGDDRFMSAVLQGGELWTSANVACTPLGDSSPRSCIKVLEIGVAGHTKDLESTSGINGKYLYYPTLGIDANGNLAIGYSLSSATDYPAHGYMIQPVGQTTPTDKGILQAGTGAYVPSSDTIHRWGDYGAVARDPIEPTRLWVAGEYSIGPDWGTGIAAIDFTTLTLSPTGIGFGPQLIGTTSAAQVLTVTNQGDDQVTITDGLSSGDTSQFSYSLNGCSTILPSLSTCTVRFTFSPTTAGVKQARFTINAPHYVRSLVLSGIGVARACTSVAISTDVTSPQNVGQQVTLHATWAGCPSVAPPLYKFYLRSPAGVWSVVQNYSENSGYGWNTSGATPGTYLIGVWVKDAQSSKTYDAYAFGTFTLEFPSCTSTNISSNALSPQQPGATVTFTATAARCTNQFFQWWVRNKAGVWSIASFYNLDNNTFVWNTAGLPMGTYQVGVWAIQQGSTKQYEAFAFVTYTLTVVPVVSTTHCEAVNVVAVPVSPSDQGTPVTFTATALGCAAEYRWWVRDTSSHWSSAPGYSATNTYAFTPSRPAGTYLVGVWVRQIGKAASYEAYSFITYTFTIAPANRVCSSVGISPDAASPQAPGTTITFTASAAGCSLPNYKFWLLPPGGTWAVVQDYTPSNTYLWNTAALAPGPYQIGVWARRTGSAASYEAFAFITFQLEVTPFATPCTILAVSTSPDQVISQGSAIQFTAVAGNCSTPVYQFYLRKGTGAFSVVQAYSANTFTWTPTGGTGGPWTLEVVARDNLETNAYDTIAFTDFTVN